MPGEENDVRILVLPTYERLCAGTDGAGARTICKDGYSEALKDRVEEEEAERSRVVREDDHPC